MPEKVIQTKPFTPPSTQAFQPDLVDKKRKRNKKRKKVAKEGKGLPSKEAEP